MAFEQRVAAAIEGTTSAAARVQEVYAAELAALRHAWDSASSKSEDEAVQSTALMRTVSEYTARLERFSAAYPACAPATERPSDDLPAGAATRRSSSGWAVTEDVLNRLRGDMHAAESTAQAAKGRFFATRQWEVARANAEAVLGMLLGLRAEATRLERAAAATAADRDKTAARLRGEADRRLREATAALGEARRRLPPALTPWEHPGWASWAPALDHGAVLLGELRPPATSAPGRHHGFGWELRTPVFISMREAVQISYQREDRSAALALARSLLLRAIASTPPGKLLISVFDPTGLGQSVSPLLELAEYDRELIGGKVWSSSEDLYRVLGEQTAHIELVIQKYLRAEYASLAEFNRAAGEIAEPLRLLAVLDAPAGFDDRSLRELRRIIENGPRCGVATLLLTDESVPAPHGVSFDALPVNLRRIHLRTPVAGSGTAAGLAFDLLPENDANAAPSVVASVVGQVGRAARQSTTSAVSFDRTFALFSEAALEGRRSGLPTLTSSVDVNDSATWWTQSTVRAVAAPIGLRGARDVATLTFDSSDHAGALLVGRPGSGKSTLLHTFIGGITTMYSPEELELHLIDFREGVEFKVYAAHQLPHARTIAIESDREFGLSVLQAIIAEMTRRGAMLRGSDQSHSSLVSMRETTGEPLPRIVLLFDEFQVLFARADKLGSLAAEALETLIRQGRGFGIHVLLGSQSLAGLDALGSHVPQLLPVRILLPAADSDVFKVMGEANTEGTALTSSGEGILNAAGGAIEANERFRGALLSEQDRRERTAAMRVKADAMGFRRRAVVFEGNAPIPAQDTPAPQYVDEIRGGDPRSVRLRFSAPMAVSGNADIELRRESGANIVLVSRDTAGDGVTSDTLSVPRAVASNIALSAAARGTIVEAVDLLPLGEGIAASIAPLVDSSLLHLYRRRQVPGLLGRIAQEIQQRTDEDDVSAPAVLLLMYGMHRARDFDQDAIDYDATEDLPELLTRVMRDGPEVGVHTVLWFDTVASITRRLPPRAMREAAWRAAGRMAAEDSVTFTGHDSASTLREQQILLANEDRGIVQRATVIAQAPTKWVADVLTEINDRPKELI